MTRMRGMAGLAFFAATVAVVATPLQATSPPEAPAHHVETPELILEWTETPDSVEVRAVTEEATRLYMNVAALLDERPAGKITIVLGGRAEQAGRRDYPRVDSSGRVLLFTFTPGYQSYFSALAHELVHAFRFARRATADWFFEEGFAEFVALRADTSLSGFPFFDYPVAVVAGQWLASREDIPLVLLRDQHAALNQKCAAQSYALRSAFFDWLGRTFADDSVYQMAKETPAGRIGDYETYFGVPFAQLEAAWRAAALAEFEALPDGAARGRQYRAESPIQYQNVCEAGKDF